MISKSEVERLIASVSKDVIIVLDSAYAEYIPQDNSSSLMVQNMLKRTTML